MENRISGGFDALLTKFCGLKGILLTEAGSRIAGGSRSPQPAGLPPGRGRRSLGSCWGRASAGKPSSGVTPPPAPPLRPRLAALPPPRFHLEPSRVGQGRPGLRAANRGEESTGSAHSHTAAPAVLTWKHLLAGCSIKFIKPLINTGIRDIFGPTYIQMVDGTIPFEAIFPPVVRGL